MATKHIRFENLLATACIAIVASSCAGARANVIADHSKYAISMSPVVRDQRGLLLERNHLVRVGRLEASSASVAVLYSLVPRGTYDISEEVNRQVAAAGGEAVINFSVSTDDACDILNFFPLLNALPIWPGCVPVRIAGDIVKRAPITTASISPGPPPMP